ncbi:hypothetical protein MUG84_03080 [Paenibacillus sp. KQZ6P-2]|uniref:Protein kinase domain-containing protein n=1 Tax=Paenibacillus mangrovi TaxID=2931978 RepID=A0A9X2B3L9_9BACL|nr:hypothetical protein [Paenibacillus mangrovi]MCJ8010727.1 hypothetical protein [Paenibacillus mangrovi]
MSYQPNPGELIRINGKVYTVGQHPAAPGLAYAQAGRQGIVYQLIPTEGGPHEAKALKVFFPKFRIPAMVYQSETMEMYSQSPGLQVCSRDVLTPERNGELIAEHPDLLYAVLMPWVYGFTWFDIIADQRQLKRTESLSLAKALSSIGSGMEQRGLAHCDLSAPNVMLPFFSEVDLPDKSSAVELVDVEQMYSPKMDRPDVLLTGSPGYAAHRTVQSGLWSAYADRFAGAIILAEMLGWCDPLVVDKAWGESYFDQHEMQNPCERYFILKKSLEHNWGAKVVELFTRAWESQDVSSCPTFGEWLVTLSSINEDLLQDEMISMATVDVKGEEAPSMPPQAALEEAAAAAAPNRMEQTTQHAEPSHNGRDIVNRLFLQAREMEQKGNLNGALEVYRSAHHFVSSGSPMQIELEAAISGLEESLNPKQEEKVASSLPFYRSRKWLTIGIASLILIGGSGITVSQILADRAENRQMEAAATEVVAKQQEEARLAALQKQEEEKRRKADADQKRKQDEESKKLAQQKAEKQKLQDQYNKQAQYEAYLAQQKLIQEKKDAEKKQLQDLYDKQAQYEAYQEQLKIQKDKEEAAREEADRKEAARKEAARKEAETKAKELQKKRSDQVVQLIAFYNQAYNAQLAGNSAKARWYAMSFINLYEQDVAYFKTVGKVSTRANAIYKFLANEKYKLPNV